MLIYSKYEIHTARISPLGAGVVSDSEEDDEEPDELACELPDEAWLLESGLELVFCEDEGGFALLAEEGGWLDEALLVLPVLFTLEALLEVLLCVEFSSPPKLELNGGSSGM